MKLNVDFAFEGFRIVRERPYVILTWGLFLLIGNGLGMYLFMTLSGNAYAQIQQLVLHPSSDLGPLMAAYQGMLPGYAVMLPLTIIINAIVSCAIFRIVLRDEAPGFGGILFGADELRQLGVILLWWLLYFGVVIVCSFVFGLLIAIASIAGPVAILVSIIGVIGMIFVIGTFALRLSLCGVQTFDQKKINLFGSWSLSKPKWGTLLGGYLIAFLMVVLVYGLCNAVAAFIVAALNGGQVNATGAFGSPAQMGIDLFTTPGGIATLVIMYGAAQPLLVAIITGATAAAYQQLRGMKEGVQSVF